MGASSSTASAYGIVTEGKPLIAQRNFEGTIHRRFVKDVVTTLELEDQFWSKPHEYDIEIHDAKTNKLLFKVPPPKDESAKRRVLCDAYGVPVVGMEQHPVEPAAANCTEFAVIPGGFAATDELFRFHTRFNLFDFPLSLILRGDNDSPDRVRVIVTGSRQWLARASAIAIQRRNAEGDIYMIARQRPVGDIRDGKYVLDVAPGVDLSLMVLIAGAMDEMSHKHETSRDRRNVKIQARNFERAEKKKLKVQAKAQRAQHTSQPA